MATIYVIARKARQTVGHGESALVTELLTLEPYGTGEHHPAFTDKGAAEQYIKDNRIWGEAVPLVLIG